MKIEFKLFYFFHYFAVGIAGPYLSVFLYQKNYTGGQIGLILGVLPIAGLVFQPVWSFLSDILNKRRLLLLIGCLGSGVAFLGIGWAGTFIVTLAFAIFFSVMRAPIMSISNAVVLEHLEATGEQEKYSLVRLWGSLGFAVSSILMGSIFLDRIQVYFSWSVAGVLFLLGAISLFLPEKGEGFEKTRINGVRFLAGNVNFIIYLAGSVFIGMTLGVYNNYTTLFLQSIDTSSLLIGIIVSLQAFLEVPMMMAVPFFLRYLSMQKIILIGAAALPVRWLLYYFIKQPGWILPTQLINGVAAVSFFVVGVSFVDRLVSQEWRATGQGLYSSAMMGVGSGVGVYLAGRVLERFDIPSIWMLNFFAGLVGLALLAVAFQRLEKSTEQSSS